MISRDSATQSSGCYTRHGELPLDFDRQQGIDVDRAWPDRRGESGDPETVEMQARIFIGVEHEYRRLSALLLERRGGKPPQFSLCRRRVEIRHDG